MDGFDLVPSSDLRSTKAAFIKQYVEKVTADENEAHAKGESVPLLTNAEKHSQGIEAWMNSNLRAVLMSSKGNGHAAIPASMLMISK